MKILYILLCLPLLFAFTPQWIEHTVNGQTFYYHDYDTFCSYTDPCNQQIYDAYVDLYISEMTNFIIDESIITADIVQTNTIVSSNYLYASAGTFISNYPTAVQHLLNIRTLPDGTIHKSTYPPYLITTVGNQQVLNTGKTIDFLLHLLANNYREQDMILRDTCNLPQARERLSWCQ